MTGSLVTIKQFIGDAKAQGVTFGHGDPKIHLAYLTKIGILPQAIRRKVNGEVTGCYPSDCVSSLLEVEGMKNKGMTYSQIAKVLHQRVDVQRSQIVLEDSNGASIVYPQQSASASFHRLGANTSFLYMVIGVLVGFLLSTLNNQGLETMRNQANLATNKTPGSELVEIGNQLIGIPDNSVYVISLPKQNLDKLEKTNINYLINN